MKTILTLAIAATLLGCATPGSPGRNLTSSCDPCDVTKSITEMGKANVAVSEGGLKQELAPDQMKRDFKPHLGYNAGEGDLDVSDQSHDRRRQVTAGNQYNGMMNWLPTAAGAGDSGGPSSMMVGLSQSLRTCNANIAEAVENKDGASYKEFVSVRNGILDRMETASSRAAKASSSIEIDLGEAKNTNMAMAKSHADGTPPTDAQAKAQAEMFKAGAEATAKIVADTNAEYSSSDLPAPPAADAPETPGTGSGDGG